MNRGFHATPRRFTSSAMATALDVFGQRWALRVVWELREDALTFRRLRSACGGISPSVLQRRLHELRDFGVVEQVPRLGYRLSVRGQRLFPLLLKLESWSRALPDSAK